jgi:Tol biopolymer transport system component
VDVLGNVSWSRDGRLLVCGVAAGATPSLVTIARASGQVQALPVPGTATVPVWSPREDVIAYLETQTDGRTDLRFIRPDGEPAAFTLPPDAVQFTGNLEVAWAPDGRRLARAAVPGPRPGAIWVIDSTPGASRQVVQLPPATQLHGLSWTPDGTALTVGVVTRTGDIMLLER